MIGVVVLAPTANAQGVTQTISTTKAEVQQVAADYQVSKVVGNSVINNGKAVIGR